MRVIAFLLPLLLAASAHADDAPPVPDERSGTTALVLSGAGTALPVLLMATHEVQPGSIRDGIFTVGTIGLVLGPSVGHWYAGEGFSLGLGLRLAGVAVALVGVSAAKSSCTDPPQNECGIAIGAYSVLAAGTLVGAGAIYDVATAPRAAHRYNREHAITVTPMPLHAGYGVGLAGRF
jgi:hypothetical protein